MKISELKRIITEELGEEISWAFTCTKTYRLNFDRDRKIYENQILEELAYNPYLIQNINNPTEDMSMIVLRQNLDYIKLIKDPTERIVRYYIRNKMPKEDTNTNVNAHISKFIKNQDITEEEKRAHVLNNINKELEKLLINKNIENDLEGRADENK
nr:MAG TPA: hypothetical protein [Caudoviricetes sp.]